MASTTITAAAAVMKKLYDGQSPIDQIEDGNPFLAMVKKDKNFVGSSWPIPTLIGPGSGRSATFSDARTYTTAAKSKAFELTRVFDYAYGTIDGDALESMASDKGAFINAIKYSVDSKFKALANSLASAMFRDGSGTIGRISTISTGVITLTNPEDAVHFDVDMVLEASAASGTGSSAIAALGYVIAVDYNAGTVTVSATAGGSAGTPTNWVANSYLCVKGDRNAKVSGLAAWIPDAAPASTAFFGVDRTSNPVRLAGVRFNGASYSIPTALTKAALQVAKQGGAPEYAVMGNELFGELIDALGSKVQYVDAKLGSVGFRAIEIHGGTTTLKVLSDRNCQPNRSYILTPKTWVFKSIGNAPKMLTYGDDTSKLLRVSDDDSCEYRLGYRGNLGCLAPGWNGVVLHDQ